MSTPLVPITVAHGDGIGPEIMDATLRILMAAGARIAPETIDIGEKVYLSGNTSGIPDDAWESIMRTKIFLKSPITTPQGGGYKSLNVTTRKTLGLFANIRPVRTFPFVDSKHSNMDLVIVRENEEDTYGGIEHRQTDEVYQCLKLITRPGCEKIVRYAFEYAVANGRKKVTCFSKDNIMKFTDGLFHKIFEEIGAEYPAIEKEHWIIDIGSAKMADTPEVFDVIVTLNLYGDVISDIAAQIAGSVGMAAGANIGVNYAMFEAIHGSAPRRAGQNLANPSGLLNGAVMMLNHIGQYDVAQNVYNSWLRTLEDGIHTYDIFREGRSTQKVGTKEFADAVIARLGQEPQHLKAARFNAPASSRSMQELYTWKRKPQSKKELKGVDVFAHWPGESVQEIATKAESANTGKLKLQMVSNRGTKVWPKGNPETFLTDHWRLRFKAENGNASNNDVIELLSSVAAKGIDFIKTEHLYFFDGEEGYTRGQGE
jgi:isocitrate dehydrogenase